MSAKVKAMAKAATQVAAKTTKGAAAPVEHVVEQVLKAEEKAATKAEKKAKKAHAKSPFGHWADSVRGRLDELLGRDGGITLQEAAEKAGVPITRVRQHIGDLRAQERGVWGPKVQVTEHDGKVFVKLAQ